MPSRNRRRGGAPDPSVAHDDDHIAVAPRDRRRHTVAIAMQEDIDRSGAEPKVAQVHNDR